jgi:peptide chain release factor
MTHLPTGIVVNSQATRSRSQNYKIARQILAEKIERLEKGDESRIAKRAERKRTQKASKEKKSRRKYRALDEVKKGQVEDGGGGDEEVGGSDLLDKSSATAGGGVEMHQPEEKEDVRSGLRTG